MTTNNTNGQIIVNLKEIPVREIWSNEARNFTPWLAENISRLSDKINMDLNVIEIEKSVGPFSADIYAEDEYGNKVIIENQLERTDHDHLGKMITYAAGLKGECMVWITPKARPEHATAINWLNGLNTDTQFYLIELLTHRIDSSNVTVDFKIVCEPNNMTEAIKDNNKADAIKEKLYIDFWSQINNRNIDFDDMFKNDKKFGKRYLGTSAGSGMSWYVIATTKDVYVELYFTNKDKYRDIYSHKEDIEASFGNALDWTEDWEDKKTYRVHSRVKIGGVKDKDKWDDIQDTLVDRTIRLVEVLREYL